VTADADHLDWVQEHAGFAIQAGWDLAMGRANGRTGWTLAVTDCVRPSPFQHRAEVWRFVIMHVDEPACRAALAFIAAHNPDQLVRTSRAYGWGKQTKSAHLRVTP
jgi:hypothetical protein